ncbi:hypothetical protein LOK49_LG04G00432 [Camellia lanceoleosa]|uniref:Uncharacterized protein n=1 Tax=Camellia lanceoleosa TaxID=1840588 RepID=A0ACC0I233_9ERIC|nr:hypothetical protein LOK49_LG04G00432 [Camellia lanceoleosa]
MEHFRNVIADTHLADLGFVGPIFTWSNNRGGNALVRERLDRGFANDAWQLLFPHAKVYPMACTTSDHLPICVDICGAKEQRQPSASGYRMYRFGYVAWHESCEQVVADNWRPSSNADVQVWSLLLHMLVLRGGGIVMFLGVSASVEGENRSITAVAYAHFSIPG